jgi:hypothetical protein
MWVPCGDIRFQVEEHLPEGPHTTECEGSLTSRVRALQQFCTRFAVGSQTPGTVNGVASTPGNGDTGTLGHRVTGAS